MTIAYLKRLWNQFVSKEKPVVDGQKVTEQFLHDVEMIQEVSKQHKKGEVKGMVRRLPEWLEDQK